MHRNLRSIKLETLIFISSFLREWRREISLPNKTDNRMTGRDPLEISRGRRIFLPSSYCFTVEWKLFEIPGGRKHRRGKMAEWRTRELRIRAVYCTRGWKLKCLWTLGESLLCIYYYVVYRSLLINRPNSSLRKKMVTDFGRRARRIN